MTVYIDEPRYYGDNGEEISYLFADDVEALHLLASQIGLRRTASICGPLSVPCYLLTPSRRRQALAAGAASIDFESDDGRALYRAVADQLHGKGVGHGRRANR